MFLFTDLGYVDIFELLGEGKDIVVQDKIFSTITEVFKRHGAVTIDTPVGQEAELESPRADSADV